MDGYYPPAKQKIFEKYKQFKPTDLILGFMAYVLSHEMFHFLHYVDVMSKNGEWVLDNERDDVFMLEIYLTKAEDIIFCNDVYFNSVTYSNVQKEVRLQKALEFIENVSYCNGMVISKFTGMPVDLAKISTGAKTYLNILSDSNKIFSLQESGKFAACKEQYKRSMF